MRYRRKHYTPKRYTMSGRFQYHPASYRQAQEETMVSPFIGKFTYQGIYNPNRGRVDDLIRYRKYRHIVNAAKENLLARGGVQGAHSEYYRHLTNQRGVHRFPTAYINPAQRLGRNPHRLHPHAHYYHPWKDTTKDRPDWDHGWEGNFIP